jgi:hypothetical protein
MSLLCGFLVTFTGVYLLNLSRSDPNGTKTLAGRNIDTTGTDMVSTIQTRLSMEARRSMGHPRVSLGSNHGDREGLIRAYDEEEAGGFGLTDLTEESDEEDPRSPLTGPRGGPPNGHANGRQHLSAKVYDEAIETQSRKPGER